MRQFARAAQLADTALATVHDTADYLQDYAPYMHYRDAIADGLPIATWGFEGARRYLVKGRMDRGGARWTLTGAEAVLRLRALRASGDFEAYWVEIRPLSCAERASPARTTSSVAMERNDRAIPAVLSLSDHDGGTCIVRARRAVVGPLRVPVSTAWRRV